MTKSGNSLTHSETTGRQRAESERESAIGWLLSAHGSDGNSNSGRRPATAPAVRIEAVPTSTEHLDRVGGLPSLLRSYMHVVGERTVFTDRYGYEGSWPSEIKVRIDAPDEVVAIARRALAAYEELCRPLADRDLAEELTRLRSTAKAARETDQEFGVGLDTMMDELARYPADLAVWAIRFWRRNEKFYPAPSELHQLIERRLTGRNAIMDALRRMIAAADSRRRVVELSQQRNPSNDHASSDRGEPDEVR